jgi:hypothetical protein
MYYVTVQDIKNNKVQIDNKGTIIIDNLPINPAIIGFGMKNLSKNLKLLLIYVARPRKREITNMSQIKDQLSLI